MKTDTELTKAISIGVDCPMTTTVWSLDESMAELQRLADTADIEVMGSVTQKRDRPDTSTYLGRGKLEDAKSLLKDCDAKLVLVDDSLSPSQQKRLEKEFEVKVTDRTGLILDIFARRARTYEAQLQVELAQLTYMLPRLTRMWTHLSRQGGGIGTRGPGETQLETDRRQVGRRISVIKGKIEKVKRNRDTLRKRRDQTPMLTGALVGYTNAGKSTLLNTLTAANVLAEDQLFATLDPTTRQIQLPSNETVLLTDTVGFIQKLPHELVTAFRSTLEAASSAHFLCHVIDASHPNFKAMINVVNDLLNELDAGHIPVLYVFNKIDAVSDLSGFKHSVRSFSPSVFISAKSKKNIKDLEYSIANLLSTYHKDMKFRIPYNRMDIVNLLHQHGNILKEDYLETEILIEVNIHGVLGDRIMSQLI